MKIGVMDAGGGVRGIYGAAVFDWCIEKDIRFDWAAGVSAGAANVANYMSKQFGRNYRYYYTYSQHKEYMSLKNYVRSGSYIDMEYVYGTLSNEGGEYPMDYDTFAASDTDFVVVATDADTGKPDYLDGNAIRRNEYQAFMATCSVPVVNRPYEMNGKRYYDGAISDPLPLDKALEAGCDKIVVILTRPRDFIRKPDKDRVLAKLIEKKYPAAAAAFAGRAYLYNEKILQAKELEMQGKALIVAPDDIGDLDTLSRDPEALRHLYIKGLRDARAIGRFLEETNPAED